MRKIIIPARPEREVTEGVVAVNYNDLRQSMQVGICEGVVLPSGKFQPDESTLKYFEIDYSRFQSADPATGRPAGEFRRDDLFDLLAEDPQ